MTTASFLDSTLSPPPATGPFTPPWTRQSPYPSPPYDGYYPSYPYVPYPPPLEWGRGSSYMPNFTIPNNSTQLLWFSYALNVSATVATQQLRQSIPEMQPGEEPLGRSDVLKLIRQQNNPSTADQPKRNEYPASIDRNSQFPPNYRQQNFKEFSGDDE